MKILRNGVLFDTEKARKIIEIEGNIGNRKLYQTILHKHFFTIENDTELLPMTKQEGVDFLRIHQAQIEPLKFSQILNYYFGVNDKIHDPLANSQVLATVKNEALHQTFPGRQFYLKTDDNAVILSETQALEWVEENQNEIPDLDKVLKLYFPTIKRA